jgi:toxin CcdB
MAQFDVYKNTNTKTKKLYPYLLDIQNPFISDIATRIVIPLGNYKHFQSQRMQHLTPEINFKNEKLLLLTPQIASVPANILKKPIGSLVNFRQEIIASLDFATTGV